MTTSAAGWRANRWATSLAVRPPPGSRYAIATRLLAASARSHSSGSEWRLERNSRRSANTSARRDRLAAPGSGSGRRRRSGRTARESRPGLRPPPPAARCCGPPAAPRPARRRRDAARRRSRTGRGTGSRTRRGSPASGRRGRCGGRRRRRSCAARRCGRTQNSSPKKYRRGPVHGVHDADPAGQPAGRLAGDRVPHAAAADVVLTAAVSYPASSSASNSVVARGER